MSDYSFSYKQTYTEQTTQESTPTSNQKWIQMKSERQINQNQILVLSTKLQQPYEQLSLAFKYLQEKGIFIENGLMGQGGSAFILKAFSEWNQQLAVKFIKLNQQNQEDYKREYEILKIFNSPYILKVFTFYNKSNSKSLSYQIIVMERCKYDLRRYINKVIYPQQSDNFLNIYLLSLQLAKGLQVLHQNNIIHLDIKPGNILYGYDQNWKYADFGIAKVVSDDRTFTNQLQGFTMRYSSPEQYLLAMGVPSAITRASDVYSLGIIFLELTGVDITQQWIVEQKSCSLDFDEYLNPQFEKFNSMIVKQMIQYKPENRTSLQDVIQKLSTLITQQISFTKKLINPFIKGYKISMPVKPEVKISQEEKPQSKVELTNINDNVSIQQQQVPLEDKQKLILSLKQSKRSFHQDKQISQNQLSNSPRRLRSVHRSMDFVLSERSNNLQDKKQQFVKEIEIKNQFKIKLNEIPSKNIQKSSPENINLNIMRNASNQNSPKKQDQISKESNQNQIIKQSFSQPKINLKQNAQFKLKLKQQLLNSQQQSPAYLFQKQQNLNKQLEFSQVLKDLQFKSPQKNFFVTPMDQMYKK
ncbi:hypothetical protein ABPG74_004110 [Tetrahymena malaccensis]